MTDVIIQFVCAGGMSSSLLVSKMQKSAKNHGVHADIWATGVGNGKTILEKRDDIDVLLIAPQVRYQEKELRKSAEGKKTMVHVVDMRDYGMMDGEKVFTDVMKNLEKSKLTSKGDI